MPASEAKAEREELHRMLGIDPTPEQPRPDLKLIKGGGA
jgi:hypothetical protein